MTSETEYVPEEPFDRALVVYFASPINWREYARLVRVGVRAGDPLAQYAMATWYLFGHKQLRIARSPRRAVALLRDPARSLNRATYELGVCLFRGEGVRKDLAQAYRLFEQAAKQGCIAAVSVQADCLEAGNGVRRNPKRAAELRERARKLLSQTQRPANSSRRTK